MHSPRERQRIKEFLFATKKEMQEAHITTRAQQVILRVRDIYTYWLETPTATDKDIIKIDIERYGVSPRTAFDDIATIKILLGNLSRASTDYYRYLFLQRCEESFQMARDKNDARAFSATLSALGKYTRLDTDDAALPDYSQIVPQTFEITADPEASGFKRIPNLEEKIQKMLRGYIKEAAPEAATE